MTRHQELLSLKDISEFNFSISQSQNLISSVPAIFSRTIKLLERKSIDEIDGGGWAGLTADRRVNFQLPARLLIPLILIHLHQVQIKKKDLDLVFHPIAALMQPNGTD